jgi:phenylacetic acid degradation operon negative regulatory protein
MMRERNITERTAGGLDPFELLDRPLSARSVIASLLLGMKPPALSARRLVQWCALFGVTEGTARTALSRMVERGELATADGVYELAGRVRRRQPAQEWSLAPEVRAWDGDWLLGVVTAGARSAEDRGALRDAVRRLRMAEVREGVWTRPDNLPRAAAPVDAWKAADEQCGWWTGRPEVDAGALARRLFDPTSWATRARMFRRRLSESTAALDPERGDRIAAAFVVGAATLAHVRADPLLPIELCGSGWPGDALRDAYHDYQIAFDATARKWFRQR